MTYRFLENSILGQPLGRHETYSVLGAGISGLLIGYYLKKNNYTFRIYEKSPRTGGLLQSVTSDFGKYEAAANGFIWCEEIGDIVKELQLNAISSKAKNAKYFVRNKKLSRYPLYVFETIKLLSRCLIPHSSLGINTVHNFGKRYFGKAFTDFILEPALTGIYAARTPELSFPATMPMLAKEVEKHSWLPLALKNIKGQKAKFKGTYSFKNGMQDLVDTLTEYLKDEISLNYNVDSLDKSSAIICLPAYEAANFFAGHSIQAILKNIHYVPLISMSFIFNRTSLKKFKSGFGCLVPSAEHMQTLGVLFNNCIFSNRVFNSDHLSLTCIVNGKNLMDVSENMLIEKILEELNLLFKITEAPLEIKVFKHPKAIPVYNTELYNNWFTLNDCLKKDFPKARLFGNYTGQISIRGLCQEASRALSRI